MSARPIIIDLQAEQSIIKYTAGDDLSVTATVLETVNGTKSGIIWGSATAVGNIREFESDTSVLMSFDNIDVTTNGQITIYLTAAHTWSLGNKKYRFSIQVTRNSRKLTYWAGQLEPRVEATHP